MTSIIREPNFEQKITDLSHTNDIFPRRSLAFWKPKKYQDHRNSIEIPILLSINFNNYSLNAYFMQGAMLNARYCGGWNDFQVSTALAVFVGNSSICMFIPDFSYFFSSSQRANVFHQLPAQLCVYLCVSHKK